MGGVVVGGGVGLGGAEGGEGLGGVEVRVGIGEGEVVEGGGVAFREAAAAAAPSAGAQDSAGEVHGEGAEVAHRRPRPLPCHRRSSGRDTHKKDVPFCMPHAAKLQYRRGGGWVVGRGKLI